MSTWDTASSVEAMEHTLETDVARDKVRRLQQRQAKDIRRSRAGSGPLIGNCYSPGTDIARYLNDNLIRATAPAPERTCTYDGR